MEKEKPKVSTKALEENKHQEEIADVVSFRMSEQKSTNKNIQKPEADEEFFSNKQE